ncbi:MAG TPA: alpha-amylase family glycosyl hydrolase [Bacteroidia bacterium]|jgi:alpha-amylase|nr:alpha-amylase family glycosyl hydrolase [Bacteroidia bacterium]
MFRRLFVIVLMLFSFQGFAQQMVLQGFWWDYWNTNYPNEWSNYLSDLAPRLQQMGISDVWVPPNIKNGNQGDGYAPFDDYDLGDKYQKTILRTRSGDKDELLRMVAVLHANGIGVVQDIVLNHLDDAGSASGAGGQDPAAWDDNVTNRYKNFRFSCFTTPATDESASDYLSRKGRFSKNWENFHPTPADNSVTGDWNVVLFGPDISYVDGAYGQSSNAIYNPLQDSGYMRTNTRQWCVWYKKQMGFDGGRWDAVKNYPYWAVEDFLYNLQHNAGWATGGDAMFNVGEWVGSASDEDTYETNVNNREGTFDFALRDGIYQMVSGGGSFDIGTIPGFQQNNRFITIGSQLIYRTCPFVNSHDSFRPQLDANGNITGWNTSSELIPHIDPSDVRLSAAYAIAFAVDGNPVVFFEDLFDVESTGKRFSHLPMNAADLPVRSDIANLIWCHQHLNFKGGAYKVRYQATDHLVIERSGKAVIGINDNYTAWQNNYVLTDFAPGTQLKDYSGANGTSVLTVDGSGGFNINTPPCNGTAAQGRKGYSVWAPVSAATGFSLPAYSTTQEWDMADDLGDSHANSLGQGGALPANSTACRIVGNIFASAGSPVTVNVYPTDTTQNVTVELLKNNVVVYTLQGRGFLSGNYTATDTSWYTAVIKNTSAANHTQEVYVKLNYNAPVVASTLRHPSPGNIACADILTNATTQQQVKNKGSVYPNPTPANGIHLVLSSGEEKNISILIYNALCQPIYHENLNVYRGSTDKQIIFPQRPAAGLYLLSVPELGINIRFIVE